MESAWCRPVIDTKQTPNLGWFGCEGEIRGRERHRAVAGLEVITEVWWLRARFDGHAECVLRHVADLTGQIRNLGSRICPDMLVADLAGSPAGFRSVVLAISAGCGFNFLKV